MREPERLEGVLLDQQDRQPRSRFSSRIAPKICRTTSGARPRLGSSSNSRRGRDISARPIDSICCSPPDKRAAPLVHPLLQARKQREHLLRAAAREIGAPPPRAPICRFSYTVMRPKMRRPSGRLGDAACA